MNGENIIPKITDKRGMLWKQPHRRYIEIDEEYALMTKQTFEDLREYSVTIPSGEYEGKMWKANRGRHKTRNMAMHTKIGGTGKV